MILPRIAHCSRCEFIVGYARHSRDELLGASFIGFTSTAIELGAAITRAAFGGTRGGGSSQGCRKSGIPPVPVDRSP